MRKYMFALAFVSSSAFSTVASADDWSGFYVGAHAGYGWGEHEGKGIYTDATLGPIAVLSPEINTIDLDGGLGGLQAGFNFKQSSIVFGIEGDVSWSGIDGEDTFISDPDGNGVTDYTWNIKTDIKWLATLRGRVGYLVTPDFLIFGTGGVAWARTESDEVVVGFPPQGLNHETTVIAKSKDTQVGWVAGAGGEWAFAPNWRFVLEWQHLEFNDVDSDFKGVAYPTRPTAFAYDQDSFPGSLTVDVVRAALNFDLGAP